MMTNPAGVGDKLRELSGEVAMLATGRDAALWLYALESLARQADELERQRNEWRASITRVRTEVATWARMEDYPPGEGVTLAATVAWCAEQVRGALDGAGE